MTEPETFDVEVLHGARLTVELERWEAGADGPGTPAGESIKGFVPGDAPFGNWQDAATAGRPVPSEAQIARAVSAAVGFTVRVQHRDVGENNGLVFTFIRAEASPADPADLAFIDQLKDAVRVLDSARANETTAKAAYKAARDAREEAQSHKDEVAARCCADASLGTDEIAGFLEELRPAVQAWTEAVKAEGKVQAEFKAARAGRKEAAARKEGLERGHFADLPLFRPKGTLPQSPGEDVVAAASGVPLTEALGGRDGITEKILEALADAAVETVGDLLERNERGRSLEEIQGIGESKAEKIANAMVEFWTERPAGPAAGPETESATGDGEAA